MIFENADDDFDDDVDETDDDGEGGDDEEDDEEDDDVETWQVSDTLISRQLCLTSVPERA